MDKTRRAGLLLLALAVPLGGCIVPYSRVGGSAHRKLYRGEVEDIAAAAERAIAADGVSEPKRELDGQELVVRGAGGSVVGIQRQEEGLVAVEVRWGADWRTAARLHRRIAEELGLLKRRNP